VGKEFLAACKKNDLVKVLELIVQGADVDYQEEKHKSRTALIDAIVDSRFTCVELLVLNRANIGCYDVQRWNALHYAAARGDTICVQFMLKNAENKSAADCSDVNGSTPLDIAMQKKQADCMKVLLDFQSTN